MNDIRTILNFPDYTITKDGMVWSNLRILLDGRKMGGKWLQPQDKGDGHLIISLRLNGRTHLRQVHRLVLLTFVGPCPEGMECRHLDGNPTNNSLDNLKWGIRSDNLRDRVRHRRKGPSDFGLTEERVWAIYHSYHDKVYTQQELANIFGVDRTTISHIVRGLSWKHLQLGK